LSIGKDANEVVIPPEYSGRVSKAWKPAKPTVELRPPSRIRRDPVREEKKVAPRSREFEIWMGVTGVALFAVIIAMLTVGFSIITGSDDDAPPPVHSEQFLRCGIGDGSDCVVDGDTIRIDDETVNIAGIEAPKVVSAECDKEAQRGGEAIEKLLQLLNSGKVTKGANVVEADGQVRTKVLVNGTDVGTAMINAGAAREYGTVVGGWCS
jgi:micrococcal nuclease